jgi:hypothetical protein
MSKRQATIERGLTRGEVAGLLGTSVSSVRRMEGKTLHPIRDRDGVWRFDPDEVKRVPSRWREPEPRRVKKREGRLAARVFALFDEGMSLSEIVQELEEPPTVIRGLYAEWCMSLDDGERARADAAAVEAERAHWGEISRVVAGESSRIR